MVQTLKGTRVNSKDDKEREREQRERGLNSHLVSRAISTAAAATVGGSTSVSTASISTTAATAATTVATTTTSAASATTTASHVHHVEQTGIDLLVGLLENSNELLGLLGIVHRKESER